MNQYYYADAFLWKPSVPNGTKGSLTDLGTLGGYDSEARGINSFGQVIGYADQLPTGKDYFLWTPTAPISEHGLFYRINLRMASKKRT